MAYDKQVLEEKSLKIIEEKKIYFIEDLVSYLRCSKATFYNLKLNELDSIKEAIEIQRVNLKSKLRQKWEDSDNPTLQIGLYKLVGNDSEAERLGTTLKHSGNIDSTVKHIDYSKIPTEALEAFNAAITDRPE